VALRPAANPTIPAVVDLPEYVAFRDRDPMQGYRGPGIDVHVLMALQAHDF